MATKIRLMRLGKIRTPYYRIVVGDSRTKRDGRVIETIGKYHPKQDPSFIEVDSERAQYWLGVGAQPTEPVAAILKITGDWQKFKGLPAPTEGLRTAAPRPDRKAVFEAAAKEAAAEPESKAAKKAPAKKAAKAAPVDEPETAEAPAAADETPAAEVSSEPAPEAASEPAPDTSPEPAAEAAAPDSEPAAEEATAADDSSS